MLQLLEVRSNLEELVFRLAAKRMTPEVEAELRQCLANLEEATAANDHFRVAEADLKFHKTVWTASGNTLLEKALDRLCISVYAYVSLQRHAAGEKQMATSHEVLLDALLQRDSKLISKRICEHLSPELVIPAGIDD